MKHLFIILIALVSITQAKEYKSVFDCSSGNASYLLSRMHLIERTINMIEEDGNSVKFALTIHGSCAPIVSKNMDEIFFDDNKLATFEKAKIQLIKLINKKNVETVVCAMSLNANTIDESDVIDSVKISKNSFIDTIGYQNDGYALMTFK